MNTLVILAASAVFLLLGYLVYSRYIYRVLRSCDRVPTPARALEDGVDYVPTPTPVLFSHHYATIAGAGPIVGPTIAAIYGIWPALVWVVVASVFFGAVHDYTSMFVSLREKGRTVAEITGNLTGRFGFLLYIAFTLLMIFVLTAAFLDLSTIALTSTAPAHLLELEHNPFGWETSVADGVTLVRIGGIATMSVIIITLCAPLMGLAIHRYKVNPRIISAIAVVIALGSIWFGLYHPVSFGALDEGTIRLIWMFVLAAYVLLASALPVWIILQPRDFVNAFTLYSGMALLIVGVVVGGIRGVTTDPLLGWNVAEGAQKMGALFPVLFITIACGAISGFHGLVSSGTSSKQCLKESDARRIGYGGMLTEGLLAVLVLIAICAGLGHDQLLAVQWPEAAKGNPVLSFGLGAGLLLNKSLGIPVYLGTVFGLLMVEGFIVTTLDTAVRLNRYLFEELWRFLYTRGVPKLLRNTYFNAGLAVVVMLALALPNGWKIIWPVFGTTNQLMAALTLATVSIWLAFRARPVWFTLYPAIFMMATCLYNLVLIVTKQAGLAVTGKGANWSILVLSVLLFLLGLGVIWIAATKLWEVHSGRRKVITTDPADEYLEKTGA